MVKTYNLNMLSLEKLWSGEPWTSRSQKEACISTHTALGGGKSQAKSDWKQKKKSEERGSICWTTYNPSLVLCGFWRASEVSYALNPQELKMMSFINKKRSKVENRYNLISTQERSQPDIGGAHL